jgi:Family of unknown function (DUF6719)
LAVAPAPAGAVIHLREKNRPMRKLSAVLAIAVMVGLAVSARAEILKREPAMGSLKPGQTVLVDDGTCPKGQVKEVTGGDHQKVGGKHQLERQRRCVAR